MLEIRELLTDLKARVITNRDFRQALDKIVKDKTSWMPSPPNSTASLRCPTSSPARAAMRMSDPQSTDPVLKR